MSDIQKIKNFLRETRGFRKKRIVTFRDLEEIVAFYEKVKLSWTLQEKKKKFKFVIEYVMENFDIYCVAFGNPILKRIRRMIDELTCELTEPSDYKININCMSFLTCLIDLGTFLSKKLPAFLPSKHEISPLMLTQSEVQRLYPPLTAYDAGYFILMVAKNVHITKALSRSQTIIVLNILGSAFMHGLLDNLIATLDEIVKCNSVIIPSKKFPYPSATDLDMDSIKLEFHILMASLEDLNKLMKCDIKAAVMKSLKAQFYGRVNIEMRLRERQT